MRVLIVDDERPARDKLRRLLEQEPDITAIGEARDGVDALEQLSAFAPDLLLLDIEMPEVSGLDVAASLPAPAPLVVFVTAYDDYAIRAFDANAIDYLLKPYDQQRLRRALDRARARLPQGAPASRSASAPSATPASASSPSASSPSASTPSASQVPASASSTSPASTSPASASSPSASQVPASSPSASPASASASTASPAAASSPFAPITPVDPAAPSAAPASTAITALPAPVQLLVPERGGMRVVRVQDIAWIETADNYVVLHTADGQPLMRQTLAGLLDKLGPRFVRCHRRAAVQLDWVASIEVLDKGDGELLLRGGARVPCSRQFRADVVARLQAGAVAG